MAQLVMVCDSLKMTIILSSTDWSDLFEESATNGNLSYPTEHEIVLRYPEYLGNGYWQHIKLPDDISIDIENHELCDRMVLEVPPEENCPEIGFRLAGNRQLYTKAVHQEGQNFLILSEHRGGTTEYDRGRHLKVDINLTPQLWAMLIVNQAEYLPPQQQLPLYGAINAPYYDLRTTTPVMQSVLYQILNCPYHDLIRRVYLQAKALELVALWLDQELNYRQAFHPFIKLRPDDVDRIQHARTILIRNLDNPPTLLELARHVGVNDRKLKEGFRQIFGTTVFKYLHNHRMEQAKYLLLEQKLTVAQAAHAVGYSHLSHFAAAFKKKFGMNPSALL